VGKVTGSSQLHALRASVSWAILLLVIVSRVTRPMAPDDGYTQGWFSLKMGLQ
jgi:hypothetical protein